MRLGLVVVASVRADKSLVMNRSYMFPLGRISGSSEKLIQIAYNLGKIIILSWTDET